MIHLSEIQRLVGGTAAGPSERHVSHVLPLRSMHKDPNALSWCSPEHLEHLEMVRDGLVICPEEAASVPLQGNVTILMVADPKRAFSLIVSTYFDDPLHRHIHPSVVMDGWVERGENVHVGPNTYLHKSVVLGNDVTIGANCTIGAPGFGYYAAEDGVMRRMPHVGGVLIEDGVEIGNNVCIDRGTLGVTRIGRYARIDNLVHIAHNVYVGDRAVIIAHAMIGGSAHIGNDVWIAPSACIRNGITVGDKAVVGLAANVVKDVPPGVTVMGNPARPRDGEA